MPTKDQAREQLQAVISRYEAISTAERRRLNEASVRTDFIEPMFEALGWDTRDSAEVDKEVRVGETWADYAFRVDGVTRFYLEAKKPSADIEDEKFSRQAVSYAWAKGVSWAVLTNFETLKLFVVDADRQNINDLRVLDLDYDQYMERFDEDLWPLAKQNVRDTGLRQAFEHRGGAIQKQTSVDERLFELFKEWREELLAMFQKYNRDQGLTLGQIDEAVQRLLDRLIFIRTVEDRRIEDSILAPILRRRTPDNITNRVSGAEAWESLRVTFRDLDAVYDSNLFEGHLLDTLNGDESVILPILWQLYYPPKTALRFNFAAIEADVLGRVYEQYLGHVAQTIKMEVKVGDQMRIPGLEPANEQSIELVKKQGKRKQQGIYYTPKYIVDYIVEQTLGRLLDERGGDRDFVESIRVLDPACGSGSFLIGAYDRLLAHYAGVQQLDGPEHLSQDDRVAILQRHIYGVDLDPQAVEIARLNLVMRALKEQDELPLLDDNIVRGNSLISGDAETLEEYFGENWRDKYPLNWEERFPEIVGRGGFDVVIGNPPYVRVQNLNTLEKDYFAEHYLTATQGNYDIYGIFIECGSNRIRNTGCLGYIVPHRFFKTDYGRTLRELLLDNKLIRKIFDFDGYMIFDDASINTCIILLDKTQRDREAFTYQRQKPPYVSVGELLNANTLETSQQVDTLEIARNSLSDDYWIFIGTSEMGLWQKVHGDSTQPLGSLSDIFVGLQTSRDKVYVLEVLTEADELTLVKCRHNNQTYHIETDILRPYIARVGIEPYFIPDAGLTLLFPYDPVNNYNLIPEREFSSRYPRAWSYLKNFENELRGREHGKFDDVEWYRFGRNQSIDQFDQQKLIVQVISSYNRFCIDKSETYFSGGGNGPYYGVRTNQDLIDAYYLSGILNSSLLQWIHTKISMRAYETAYSYGKRFIERLPIHIPSSSQKESMTDLIELVQFLRVSYSRLHTMPETVERKELERQIAAAERELDQLVYELYGLTEEEIAIVKAAVK